VIRRAFWLGAGAAAGIMGYRRVEAIGRKVTGRVPGTVTGASLLGPRKLAPPKKRTALRMARETMRFTRDVREGMDLYYKRGDRPPAPRGMARRNRPEASTLSKQQAPTPIAKDGR
jgi:hypothetical protein